jgi:hypothetical protein
MNDHSDYSDYEMLIRKAHMERSMAVGNAIASVISAAELGLTRAIDALKSAAGRSKARARADANAALDVPAHRSSHSFEGMP